ncbi:MAG: hypothetical protein D3916_18980, partial [Candidatus Electrothrix sp. MAN1_4]|nr:hypothetical protein [Candidatus Electrothrix sp. MAN1_4]
MKKRKNKKRLKAVNKGSGKIEQNRKVTASESGVAIGGNVQDGVHTHSGNGDLNITKQTNILLQPLKPRTLILASVLVAGVLSAGPVGWHLFTPAEPTPTSMTNSISVTGDNAGEQIITQG